MHHRLTRAVALFAAALLTGGQARASAQGSTCEGLRCVAASEALRLFESEAKERRSERGHAAVLYILTSPGDVPASRQDSVASGLEAMILGSEHPSVRTRAAMYLTSAGSREFATPLRDASHRVVRVYRETGDPAVRARILDLIFQLSDRPRVLPLLREVAKQPGLGVQEVVVNHDLDDPTRAVDALSRMGDEGRTVLRELHRTKAVRSARAAALLEHLSRRDYRLENR